MRIGSTSYRSIWPGDDGRHVEVIDQRILPFSFEVMKLHRWQDARAAIADMVVRGAPLIGVTAAWGMYLAAFHAREENWCGELEAAAADLKSARPTAVNLAYAVDRMQGAVSCAASRERAVHDLFHLAAIFTEAEVDACRRIGEHGLALIRAIQEKKHGPVNILTHCNAGWLACVDYGTATAPIYLAHDRGIKVHVWVDETRPRNQGARLTAYELGQHGVPHTVITDNAGGHLMQHGEVDLVIVGSDRCSRRGDVVNKIGTYLKALAARDNGIPFYAALPSSTIDFRMEDGFATEIEDRGSMEVTHMEGWNEETRLPGSLRVLPKTSPVRNPGFDVTPARLVTGLITERGVCEASEAGIRALFGP